jgi:hypothetical protein
MLDLGLCYDSSLSYSGYRADIYGRGPRRNLLFAAPSGRPILELPVSTVRLGPVRARFCGGGYLRLLPAKLIAWLTHRRNRQDVPVVVYLHPRDFAVDCPRIPMSAKRRFMCYFGLSSTEHKLRCLCREFRFGPCASVLGLEHLGGPVAAARQAGQVLETAGGVRPIGTP